jgi:para-aminobenzoate synthetase component 1
MLNWLRPFSIFCYLDNQQYQIAPHTTDCLVAAGSQSFITGTDIKEADDFLAKHQWSLGI